jgi:hypothetical protein
MVTMYGILSRSPDLVRADVGEFAHFLVDDVSGRRRTPLDGAINAVACWGNTELVHEHPDRAAVTAGGERATPAAEGHHWGTVCPTDPDYRAAILDRIEEVGARGATSGSPRWAFRARRSAGVTAASDCSQPATSTAVSPGGRTSSPLSSGRPPTA